MPKLKRLGNSDVIKILESFGFSVVSQKGIHIKLVRQRSDRREVLVVPNHKELKIGTLKAIFNQASQYVSSEELKSYFYTA